MAITRLDPVHLRKQENFSHYSQVILELRALLAREHKVDMYCQDEVEMQTVGGTTSLALALTTLCRLIVMLPLFLSKLQYVTMIATRER